MITKREINITSFHKLLCNMTQAKVFICLNISSRTGPVFLFSPAFNIKNVNFITTYIMYLHNYVSIWCISVVKQRWTNLLVPWCFGLYFLLLCIVISVANLFTKTNGKTQSHLIGQNFITRTYMVNQKKNQYFTFFCCNLLRRSQSIFWYWWAYVSAWCIPVPCIYFSNTQSYINANVCMCISLRTPIILNACMHFLYVFGQFPCILWQWQYKYA